MGGQLHSHNWQHNSLNRGFSCFCSSTWGFVWPSIVGVILDLYLLCAIGIEEYNCLLTA